MSRTFLNFFFLTLRLLRHTIATFTDILGSSTSYRPTSTATMAATSPERAAESGGDEADEVSRFLDMPPELRKLVYDELLIWKEPIDCRPRDEEWRLPRIPEQQCKCAILRTCKLIHQEATPVLYGENTLTTGAWSYKADEGFPKFMKNIGNSAQYIREVKFTERSSYRGFKKTCTLLKAVGALSSLTIEWRTRASYSAERLAKDLGPLARLLHRNQLRETDKKPRDILDGLRLLPRETSAYLRLNYPDTHARYDAEAAEFERKVKGFLRATLK